MALAADDGALVFALGSCLALGAQLERPAVTDGDFDVLALVAREVRDDDKSVALVVEVDGETPVGEPQLARFERLELVAQAVEQPFDIVEGIGFR